VSINNYLLINNNRRYAKKSSRANSSLIQKICDSIPTELEYSLIAEYIRRIQRNFSILESQSADKVIFKYLYYAIRKLYAFLTDNRINDKYTLDVIRTEIIGRLINIRQYIHGEVGSAIIQYVIDMMKSIDYELLGKIRNRLPPLGITHGKDMKKAVRRKCLHLVIWFDNDEYFFFLLYK